MRHAKRLLIIGSAGHYAEEIVRGIHRYCRAHGRWEYHTVADNSPEAVKVAEIALLRWKADGIIAHVRSERVERLVKKSGLPAVNVSGVREPKMPMVISDHGALGRMAAQHFLEKGFRNFGFFAETMAVHTHDRLVGLLKELKEAGLGCEVFTNRAVDLANTALDWVRIAPQTDRWLKSLAKPVAIVCINDVRAQEIAVACQRVGLHVPEDVAILGIGNQEIICQMSAPPLSSVDSDLQRIGYEAARVLDRLVRRGKAPARPILVKPLRVIVRQSSDVVAIDDPDISAAVRFIRAHAAEPINVKDILREVPMCRKTMDVRFMKYLNHTPAEEIRRVRMEKAKGLLMDTDMAISGVAERAGFTGQEVFSTFFHRAMGITPTAFRRKCREGGRA